MLFLHLLTLNENIENLSENGPYEDSCTGVHRPSEQHR